jgi:hypothetical protein
MSEEVVVNVTPYEVEISSTHVIPGSESIKEWHVRVSAPTFKSAQALVKQAMIDVVQLRSQHK